MEFHDNPIKDRKTNEKYIDIRLSNKQIRYIKSAITVYEGDNDDLDNEQTKQEIREIIHEKWKKLNPS